MSTVKNREANYQSEGSPDRADNDGSNADSGSGCRSKKWPQTLHEILEVLAANFVRRGFENWKAEAEARAAALELARYFGGGRVYFPGGSQLKNSIRDAEIFRVANGRNTDELAQRYRMTERNVQRIVKEQTEIHSSIRRRDRESGHAAPTDSL
jgi:Mor family transcriptional regulator